jgi:ATP-dependent Clp protease ATP-binding subunit ClpA
MDEYHLFEQYDEPARNTLRFAEVEARLFQQDAIGTEHLLLGVLHHPPTRAATMALYFPFLDPLGANLDDVRAIVEQVVGQGKGTTVRVMGFTSEAQQALDEACEEALRSNRGYVGVKQLLFGVLAVPQSQAQRVLQSLGIDLDQVHSWVSPVPSFPSTPAEVTRFGRLTEQARQAVSLSQEEARRLQHHWAGGEHLVLGLLCQDVGVAAEILANAGVELNAVRELLVSLIGRGEYAVPGEIALTPRARKIILRAVDEAELLGHAAGETGHLLLSLVREDEGIAAGIFKHLGMSREDIRTETLRRLTNEATSEEEQ